MVNLRLKGYESKYGSALVNTCQLLFGFVKKKSKKTKKYSKITRVDETRVFSIIRAGSARAVYVEETYLSEPENWPTMSQNTGAIPTSRYKIL